MEINKKRFKELSEKLRTYEEQYPGFFKDLWILKKDIEDRINTIETYLENKKTNFTLTDRDVLYKFESKLFMDIEKLNI